MVFMGLFLRRLLMAIRVDWSMVSSPIDGVVTLYEAGRDIGRILYEIKDRYDCSNWDYDTVKYYLSVYKYLKERGRYHAPADIELYDPDAEEEVDESNEEEELDEIEEDESCESDEEDEEDESEEEEDDDDDEEEETPTPCMPESEIVSDPSKSFQAMKRAVTVVAKRVGKALIISGNGGIGKSYAVNQVLEAYGHRRQKDYNILKTKCTPINMYKFLYRNRDKICVFDDCDSILQNVEGRSILKSALDSDNVREVFWNTDGCDVVDTTSCEDNKEVAAVLAKWSKKHDDRQAIPNHFFFSGSVIIISNMKKADIKKLDEALVTRCHTVEVSLSNQEILDRLEGLLDDFKIYDANNSDISDDDLKQEVFDWISSEEFLEDERMEGKTLNFRLFVNTYKALYANGDDTDDWKQVAFQG